VIYDVYMIPVVIITGFLGSGKTTLLNYILENQKDYKIGVILNEFGEVNLESQFVKTQDEKVVELAAGCVCCVARGDISKALDAILEYQKDTEVIVMEASGLSDAVSLSVTMYTPSIAQKFLLDAVICVVDCINFEKTLDDNEVARGQLVAANIVYLSKVNEAGTDTVNQVRDLVGDLNPKAMVVENVNELNLDLILGTKLERIEEEGEHHHDHDDYETYTFETNEAVDYHKFENYIRSLPKEIYRVKGYINFKNAPLKKKYLLQYVMGRRDYILKDLDDVHNTHLLFVGKDLDKETIRSELSGIIFNNNMIYNTISKIFNIFNS
jgi:G3E family GTPase